MKSLSTDERLKIKDVDARLHILAEEGVALKKSQVLHGVQVTIDDEQDPSGVSQLRFDLADDEHRDSDQALRFKRCEAGSQTYELTRVSSVSSTPDSGTPDTGG